MHLFAEHSHDRCFCRCHSRKRPSSELPSFYSAKCLKEHYPDEETDGAHVDGRGPRRRTEQHWTHGFHHLAKGNWFDGSARRPLQADD